MILSDKFVCEDRERSTYFTRDLVLYVKFKSDKKLSRDVSPSSEQGEDAGSTSADDTHKTPDTQSPDKNTDEKSSEE